MTVAYLYKESREGSFLQEMLKDFKGVLISDFSPPTIQSIAISKNAWFI